MGTHLLKAYRLWYEFLRRSDAYIACCESKGNGRLGNVYQRFGDVRLDWDRWWPAHRYLFEEREPDFIVQIVEPGQLSNDEGDADQLTLLLNLNHPIRTLMRDVKKLISERKMVLVEKPNADQPSAEEDKAEGGQLTTHLPLGKPAYDASLNHWCSLKFLPRPSDVKSLELTLKVFDTCTAEDAKEGKDRKKRYTIASDLKICRPISLVNGKPAVPEEANRATALVSRYYRQARNIIANAEVGSFPNRETPVREVERT